LLSFLGVVALTIVRLRHLFAAVMLTGSYSLLSAALFVVLDAVDVAFTEAAVGAGIATILMLGTLGQISGEPRERRERSWLPMLVVLITGGALLYGTLDMPPYGDPSAPVNQHVVPRYLEDSLAEVGVPNVVTSVLASYRGYDTLGETTVILTAAIGAMGLLQRRRRRTLRSQSQGPRNSGLRRMATPVWSMLGNTMQHHLILHVIAKLLVPLILLFALYVQFHGDFGPGGGFQAGVIFAAGFILYGLVFGIDDARLVASADAVRILIAAGLLLYAGVGVVAMLLGGQFLDYSVLRTEPVKGQHLGIMLIEFGVGTTVAATMIRLFYLFSR
jgi:multicomponent Na+:H+ antiporter subunit B